MWYAKRGAGFTLMEVLISLFILSIISVAALSSFQQMIRAKEVQKSHEIVLTALSFAYTTLLNDIAYEVKLENPFVLNEREITFSRAWQGGEKEADTIDIRYTWDNDSLTREWSMDGESNTQQLLKKVHGVQWQWFSEGAWNDVSVPVPAEKPVRALRVLFTDPIAGEMSWVFMRP